MRLPKPYDLVVFDLSGVLVRVVDSWADGHERAGVAGDPPTDPDFEPRRLELSEQRQRGELAVAEYYRLVADASGGVYSPGDVEAIHGAWVIGEYPGVGDVVDAVHAADVETAILSNTDEAHWALQLTDESEAERFPVVRRIGHRFGSHLLGVVKPERAVFDAVMEATGFKERRILYFDDSKRHVDASVDAGWGGVLVDPSGDPARQMLFELNRRMVTLGQRAGA